MAASAISGAGMHAPAQSMHSLAPHKHGGHNAASFTSAATDPGASAASGPSAPSSSSKLGHKLDITA